MTSEYRQPNVCLKGTRHLAKTLYGIRAIEEVIEFSSYSDRNFYIRGTKQVILDSETGKLEGEYVLKVLNSIDSKNEELVNAENLAIDFLRNRGFPCPEVCQAKDSTKRAILVEIRPANSKEPADENANAKQVERCVVRMVTMLPGKTLDNFDKTEGMLNRVGQFVGSVSQALLTFSHPAITSRYDRCDLKNFLDLKAYTNLVSSSSDRRIVGEIFAAFASQVAPNIKRMRQGTIHNDMNMSNILGTPNNEADSISITGLIDFGDITYSMVVNEIVVAMVSCMDGDHGMEVSGHLLAGYQATFPIPGMEYRMLYFLVAARICQIYIISNQSFYLNKRNTYLEKLLESYKRLMESFWGYPKEEVENIWLNCKEKAASV